MYLPLTLLTAVFGLPRQSTLLWFLHSWCASYQLHPASANGPLCKRPKMFLAWRGYNWLPIFTLLGSLPTLAGSRKLSLLSSGPWDSEVTNWRSEHCIDWAFVGIWSECLLEHYMLWHSVHLHICIFFSLLQIGYSWSRQPQRDPGCKVLARYFGDGLLSAFPAVLKREPDAPTEFSLAILPMMGASTLWTRVISNAAGLSNSFHQPLLFQKCQHLYHTNHEVYCGGLCYFCAAASLLCRDRTLLCTDWWEAAHCPRISTGQS